MGRINYQVTAHLRFKLKNINSSEIPDTGRPTTSIDTETEVAILLDSDSIDTGHLQYVSQYNSILNILGVPGSLNTGTLCPIQLRN